MAVDSIRSLASYVLDQGIESDAEDLDTPTRRHGRTAHRRDDQQCSAQRRRLNTAKDAIIVRQEYMRCLRGATTRRSGAS